MTSFTVNQLNDFEARAVFEAFIYYSRDITQVN